MDKFKPLFVDCQNDYHVAKDPSAEWPNNSISKKAIFNFDDGYFGENKTPISKEEIELCQKLSHKASEIFGDGELGLGSEGGEPLVPFWIVAVKEDKEIAKKITVDLIRERFQGSIFPPSIITIFPLTEKTNKFRNQIKIDYEGSREALNPWEKTIQWFQEQPDFIDTAMVYIGEDTAGDEKNWPKGTEMSPSCLPRLMLGLTKNGSLTGIFGYVVYT
uniref:DUF3293 domain-containing protein n=1 Tax=Panagrolaimus sp. ES5 TaxID=591445 RepID=A0AC34FI68_9BILA